MKLNIADSLAVVLPSRGLIHSRTIDSLLKALKAFRGDYSLYFSHDLPIPQCFNKPVEIALKYPHTHILIVEEDMYVPEDAINKLLEPNTDIAFYDYLLNDQALATRTIKENGYTISGTGLIMLKVESAKRLFPLRTDIEYQQNPYIKVEHPTKAPIYGNHDSYLWVTAQELGMSLEQVGTTQHFKVIQMGQPGVNDGCHQIKALGT